MNEDELLAKYGLNPAQSDLPVLRDLLRAEIDNPARYNDGNDYLKALCILLFAGGQVQDAALIYEAKTSSFDAASYIDIELICGAGLEATRKHLSSLGTRPAQEALDHLQSWEAAGEFEDFTVAGQLEVYSNYYGLS